ncbi:hypothetical protein ASPWEDRAFT_540049 [Aspergillus wentii DTO 134E9]|uniref:Uncharacterized protein n=1 Tax=Aspergillus wentii DTO 134E9 TaxID=1073089 RepID=A0A1L9RFJ1_ASPWE|nr:uncharacterized protein ASPWEDRAFT_540049 [Aspergillus wentii DTO 134E9]OJJ33691.1 hypothetical protein ASPWEDRAFT_540049 [Aspergillus wentii DTO 134E9]
MPDHIDQTPKIETLILWFFQQTLCSFARVPYLNVSPVNFFRSWPFDLCCVRGGRPGRLSHGYQPPLNPTKCSRNYVLIVTACSLFATSLMFHRGFTIDSLSMKIRIAYRSTFKSPWLSGQNVSCFFGHPNLRAFWYFVVHNQHEFRGELNSPVQAMTTIRKRGPRGPRRVKLRQTVPDTSPMKYFIIRMRTAYVRI